MPAYNTDRLSSRSQQQVGEQIESQPSEQNSLIRLNRALLSSFAREVAQNPTVDLSALLQRQGREYPEKRARQLTKIRSESRKCSPRLFHQTRCLNLDIERRREESPRHTASISTARQDDPSPVPAVDGDLTIIKPLAPEVQEVLRIVERYWRRAQGRGRGRSQERFPVQNLSAQGLLKAIEQGQLIGERGGSVVRLNSRIAVKYGTDMDFDEAFAISHIRKHAPDLPIPESLGVASINGTKYHFMTFIEGVSLDKIWSSLTIPMKQSVRTQLADLFHRLRAIPLPPDPAIGSGDPPRCKDFRRQVRIAAAKIYTERDFNQFLLSNPSAHDRGICHFYFRMLMSRMRTDHRLCMTHGDLRPANIIVKRVANGEIEIGGLINWEGSGVYPEYWEFVRALSLLRLESDDDWYDYLPTQAIGCFVDEFLLDEHIDAMIGSK